MPSPNVRFMLKSAYSTPTRLISCAFHVIQTKHVTQDRVYYISESVMKSATSINKDNLLHCGTCLGKFTKSGKFRLHITALDYLAQYSKVRNRCVCNSMFLVSCLGNSNHLYKKINPNNYTSTKYGSSLPLRCPSSTETM